MRTYDRKRHPEIGKDLVFGEAGAGEKVFRQACEEVVMTVGSGENRLCFSNFEEEPAENGSRFGVYVCEECAKKYKNRLSGIITVFDENTQRFSGMKRPNCYTVGCTNKAAYFYDFGVCTRKDKNDKEQCDA